MDWAAMGVACPLFVAAWNKSNIPDFNTEECPGCGHSWGAHSGTDCDTGCDQKDCYTTAVFQQEALLLAALAEQSTQEILKDNVVMGKPVFVACHCSSCMPLDKMCPCPKHIAWKVQGMVAPPAPPPKKAPMPIPKMSLALAALSQAPLTQKARGLWALTCGEPLPGHQTPVAMLVREPTDAKAAVAGLQAIQPNLELFARPCPITPRHGFVESRKVCGAEEVAKALAEAVQADEKAELLLMHLIPATHSGILVAESGVLSIGPGHDGATAGKDSLALPVVAYTPSAFFREQAGIAKDAHVYYETVSTPDKWLVVQARSGPPLQAGVTEFIPATTKVKVILQPTEDLLAWEKLCVDMQGKPGVVAWQAGATLACHAAIHCVGSNIPFLTRKEQPQVGAVVKQTIVVAKLNKQEIRRGLAAAQATTPKEWNHFKSAIEAGIGVLHNAPALVASPYWGRLLGFAAGMVFKATAISCLGERRYYQGDKGESTGGRSECYQKFGKITLPELGRKLQKAAPFFMHSGHWGGGYGGPPWYAGSMEGVRLFKAMTELDAVRMLGHMNNLVNMAHNSGSLLNKVVGGFYLDSAASAAGPALAARLNHIYPLLREKRKAMVVHRKYAPSLDKAKVAAVITNKCDVTLTVDGKKWRALCWKSDKVRELIKATLEEL